MTIKFVPAINDETLVSTRDMRLCSHGVIVGVLEVGCCKSKIGAAVIKNDNGIVTVISGNDTGVVISNNYQVRLCDFELREV